MNAEPPKAKTIVFVEDNPVVLMAYQNRLEREGIHIAPARDGLQAIKILSQFVPDLVVLDLMLPKFNGVEIIKFICSDPRYQTVPLIILSTNSILEADEEYVLERANKRLLKSSCTPAILLQTIQQLLSSGSATECPNGAVPADLKTGGALADTHLAA